MSEMQEPQVYWQKKALVMQYNPKGEVVHAIDGQLEGQSHPSLLELSLSIAIYIQVEWGLVFVVCLVLSFFGLFFSSYVPITSFCNRNIYLQHQVLSQNSVAFQFCSDLELRICLAPCFNRELDFGILNNTDTVKDCNDFIGR